MRPAILPYRRRNVQQVMSCRAVAHDVYLALLVVNVAPLESRRGVEIDFAHRFVGNSDCISIA